MTVIEIDKWMAEFKTSFYDHFTVIDSCKTGAFEYLITKVTSKNFGITDLHYIVRFNDGSFLACDEKEFNKRFYIVE